MFSNTPSCLSNGLPAGVELMSPEKRSAAGMFVCAIYGIALMSLAGLAYVLRDWFALSLTTSVPFVTLLAICWYVLCVLLVLQPFLRL